MSLTSLWFFLFLLLAVAVYFLFPWKKYRWTVLLAASCVFYCAAGIRYIGYILFTAASAYGVTRWLDAVSDRAEATLASHKAEWDRDKKRAYKSRVKHRKYAILALGLVLNFGILAVLKYADFALSSLSFLFRSDTAPMLSLVLPLGISFYTFQTMGYVIDVCRQKVRAERNPLKLLLFVSFFPQLMQGPISNFDQLMPQLIEPHSFDAGRLRSGAERMLWGYFKKLVIADLLAPYVTEILANYTAYPGVTVLLGVVFHSLRLYADFSGYMDIVCGLSEILGIELRENFNAPFFSRSLAEFWRRWHISLGDWFKNYLYYPIAMSGWSQKLSRWGQKRFGPGFARTVPATIALIAVWLVTGLWHGASWGYVVWGALNGLVIIVSLWLAPVYERCNKALKIKDTNPVVSGLRILRTFLLVIFLEVLPEVGPLRGGFALWGRVFTEHSLPQGFAQWFPQLSPANLIVVLAGLALVLVTDIIRQKKPVREFFEQRPVILRCAVLFVLICAILLFGNYGMGYRATDFMYFKY